MIKMIKYILAKTAFLIIAIGFFSFVGGSLVVLGLYRIIPDSFEMPLGHLKGIAVDSEGNIYCGAHFYSRIQVYDSEGKFLYGKCIDTGGGTFWIRINSNDQLQVAIARGDKIYTFDNKFNLLHKRSNVPDYSAGFEKAGEHYCYDEKRDITYLVRSIYNIPLFGSRVVKIDSSGKESVIIQTPFHKWLFMGPFPAISFVVFGAINYLIVDKKFRGKMLRNLDKMELTMQRNQIKTGGRERLINKSIVVALVSLGIISIASFCMCVLSLIICVFSFLTGGVAPVPNLVFSSIWFLLIVLVFIGVIKGHRLAWQWTRLLGFLGAVFFCSIAFLYLEEIGRIPFTFFVVLMFAFQGISLFILFFAFGTVGVRKYFNVICPVCGQSKVKSGDPSFSTVICRKCNATWS